MTFIAANPGTTCVRLFVAPVGLLFYGMYLQCNATNAHQRTAADRLQRVGFYAAAGAGVAGCVTFVASTAAPIVVVAATATAGAVLLPVAVVAGAVGLGVGSLYGWFTSKRDVMHLSVLS